MTAAPPIRTAVKPDEARRLADLARGRVVIELGAQRGFSAVTMSRTARIVHSVDWHRGDDHAGHWDTLPRMWSNLTLHEARDNVVLHVGRFADILPLFRPQSFEFAFHDAFHSTEAILADVELLLPLLVPGSLLALHDFGRYGVAEAVESLGFERVSLTRSLVVVRIP